MRVDRNDNIDNIIHDLWELHDLDIDLYITSVTNSGRRKLSRNLRPTKCRIVFNDEPKNEYKNTIQNWITKHHIEFINTKTNKPITFFWNFKHIYLFTTEKEAIIKYNELIDESKEIFNDIINYRESLKIKL